MTKAELLADLASKEFCDEIFAVEQTGTHANGTKVYHAQVRDVKGKLAYHRTVPFYVVNEGEDNEVAYYDTNEPIESNTRNKDLYEWMRSAVDANPSNYKGIQIRWLSERYEMVIYSILTGSPLEYKTYYIHRGNGGPQEIPNFEQSMINSVFNI